MAGVQTCALPIFDGEKIEQLADLDKSKEVLKKAINSLLGLEIVEQLNIDIDEFQKRSLIQLKTDEEKEKIDKLNKEIDSLEQGIKKVDENIIQTEDKLTNIKYEADQIDISLSQKGFLYYEKKNEYEKEVKEINIKQDLIKTDLVKLAGGDAPLMLIKNELEEILEQIGRAHV